MDKIFGEDLPSLDNAQAFNDFVYQGSFGQSIKVLQHFLQSARTGEVTYFDYGPTENLEIYGTESPPEIPFENTNMPIYMYNSESDNAADPVDAEWYADRIGDNLMAFEWISGTHLTFILGYDMQYLEEIIENYQPLERHSSE